MRVLVLESFSPWCERSRFVLLHHRLPFVEKEHVPLIGELTLQLRAGRIGKKVSVPLLIDAGTTVMGSLEIAEHVDVRGQGPTLLPLAHLAEIRALHTRLEPLLATGRANAIAGVLADDEIALAAAPSALRKLPGTIAASRMGARFLVRKYGVALDGIADRLIAGFEDVRQVLDGRDYVHGTFTYADVLCASALQFLSPVAERFVPLEPATRRSFTHPELASRFADLLSWRDALYEKHRPPASIQDRDPAAPGPPVDRAALALGRELGDAERERLSQAARATAAPDLRETLERAALAEDGELARRLRTLERG